MLAALYVGQDVFLPVVLAILLAFVLAPFVDVMRKWHMGRVPAVIIAVLVALGIILSLGTIIGFRVAGLASGIPRYQTTIESKVGSLREGAWKAAGPVEGFRPPLRQAVAEPPPEQQAPASPSAPTPPAEGQGRCPWKSMSRTRRRPRWPGTFWCPCSSRWRLRALCSWCWSSSSCSARTCAIG